jgi:hypothetical protein
MAELPEGGGHRSSGNSPKSRWTRFGEIGEKVGEKGGCRGASERRRRRKKTKWCPGDPSSLD